MFGRGASPCALNESQFAGQVNGFQAKSVEHQRVSNASRPGEWPSCLVVGRAAAMHSDSRGHLIRYYRPMKPSGSETLVDGVVLVLLREVH